MVACPQPVVKPSLAAQHATFVACRPAAAPRRACGRHRAQGGNEPGVNEDVLARLRAAEEEASRLKKELAAAQAAAAVSTAGAAAAAEADKPSKRIDSGDLRRETLFSVESKQRNWLSENDVSFFTGGGPSETEDVQAASKEEQSVVTRRLALGAVAGVVIGAFALVPTQQLQISKPGKPLFFYLVPILRAQKLLLEAELLVPEGNLVALQALLQRIEGEPNNLKRNLRDAAACLESPQQAEKAEALGREIFEYVKQVDYDQYFDSMRGAVRDGKVLKQYYDFSLNSAKAAQGKLRDFLALMPAEQREAAEQQVANLPF